MRVNSFIVVRYIVFALFTISNAITCSVAAWNLGLVHTTKPQQVDVYLIFLGAFSLFSIITLIFVELLCIRSLTTCVWFECTWVALFWVMELAGAAALIAVESDSSCSNSTTELIFDLCTSERVLVAFSWMCATTLLIYLLALVFIAASRHHDDLEVWMSDVRRLGAPMAKQFPTTQHLPTVIRTKQQVDVNVYTRPPARSKPAKIAQHYEDLSSKYKIEPYRPVFAVPEQVDTSYSNLPEAIPLPSITVAPGIPSSGPISVLHQDAVNTLSASLGLYDIPREREHVSSSSYPGRQPPMHVPWHQNVSLPTPSPLGDWPRQDIMRQPVKLKKHKPPPNAFEFPRSHVGGDALPDASSQPRPRRPSGPRMRLPSGDSGHRPVALDLYPGASASLLAGRGDEEAR